MSDRMTTRDIVVEILAMCSKADWQDCEEQINCPCENLIDHSIALLDRERPVGDARIAEALAWIESAQETLQPDRDIPCDDQAWHQIERARELLSALSSSGQEERKPVPMPEKGEECLG